MILDIIHGILILFCALAAVRYKNLCDELAETKEELRKARLRLETLLTR